MGIYDRDYYRDDAPRWGGAVDATGTISVMALTIGLFFFEAFSTRPPRTSELLEWGAFHFDRILHGEIWRLFTAGLIPSSGLFGLILSMILLYWAGRELERTYGTKPFVAFYLLAAFATSLGKLAVGLAGIDTDVPSAGTGGAIFAVLVLFACLNPRRTILVFFVLPVPVGLLVSLLLALAVLSMFSDAAPTKIHAVGLISGAAFGFLFFKLAPAVLTWVAAKQRRVGRRPAVRLHTAPALEEDRDRTMPVPREDRPVAPRPVRSPQVVDEHFEAKLDQVLGKVAQFGRGSLTAEENEMLQRASEIYKNKRS